MRDEYRTTRHGRSLSLRAVRRRLRVGLALTTLVFPAAALGQVPGMPPPPIPVQTGNPGLSPTPPEPGLGPRPLNPPVAGQPYTAPPPLATPPDAISPNGNLPQFSPDLNVERPKIITTNPTPTGVSTLPAIPPGDLKGTDPRLTGPGQKYSLQRSSTGLLPSLPPGVPLQRDAGEVNKQIDSLIWKIQDPEGEIDVTINHTKLIETRKALSRIAIAYPGVADVEVLDQTNAQNFYILGKSLGTTTITLWTDEMVDGKVVRTEPMTFLVRVSVDVLDLEKRIAQAFPGSVIHIRQIGPQVILEGQVTDSKTMLEILQLLRVELQNSARSQPGTGGNSAATQGAAQGAAAGAAASGASPAAAASGAAQGASSSSGVQLTIINRVHVPGPRQVMLHVKLAELNRTAIRQLGVSWLDPKNNAILASTVGNAANITATAGAPPIQQSAVTNARGALAPIASSFGASATGVPNNAQLFGIFNAGQFSIFLNALRSNAMAKILAEPNLMAMDGQPAQFLSGGQFPYPVPQSSSIPGGTAVVTVQFQNFGTSLVFIPNILANDEIQLDVQPEFSKLNFGAGTTVNGGVVPAIDKRSARTVVRLREGQTLAIAGLLQTTTNASTVRVPLLGDLPIVGGLFSSNQINTVETELVVMVTPEFVAPMEANEIPPLPGDRIFQPNDYEFYFLGRIEGKLGRDYRATIAEHDPLNVMKHFKSENYWVVGPHGHAD